MRYLIVPPPPKPRTLSGEQFEEGEPKKKIDEVSMHKYLMGYIIGETKVEGEGQKQRMVLKMGNGYEGNLRISKLDSKFKKAKPFDVVAIDDDDWNRVCDIIKEKNWVGAHLFAVQMVPHETAWMEAKSDHDEAVKRAAELMAAYEKEPQPE